MSNPQRHRYSRETGSTQPSRRIVAFQGSSGLRISGEIWGEQADPAVLFIHGIGQTRHAWTNVATRVAGEGWRCVLIDLRGHGESDWDPGHDYTLRALADDCAAVVQQLGSSPVFVGASLGGMAALYAQGMSRHPLTAGLVLVDVSLGTNHAATERIRRFMRSGVEGFDTLEQAANAIAQYKGSPRSRSAASPGLRRVLRERDGRWYWHWDPALISHFTTNSESGRMGELRRAQLQLVYVPTLVLRGGDSQVTTDDGIERLLRIAPDASVVEIPNASHMIADDQNDAFGDAVVAFLEGRVRSTLTTRSH